MVDPMSVHAIHHDDSTTLPLVAELPSACQPVEIFQRLARHPHCLFLDSALRHATLGRYSFVAADPFAFLEVAADQTDALNVLESQLSCMTTLSVDGLPPFQGGAAGLLAYELGRALERIPAAAADEFRVPALAVGLYDVVFAFDHEVERGWVISQGFPERDPAARRQRALARMKSFQHWLSEPGVGAAPSTQLAVAPLSIDDLAATVRIDGHPDLWSNFTAEQYRASVQRAIDYIQAGDIFQVNLAQRLLHPARDDAVSLYRRLRERNPAPFAGYFDLGTHQVVSASPERFLAIRGRGVEARPIKGTRQRCGYPEADWYAGSDLLTSAKDTAENIMIVDLLRNDLSRVCLPDTVRVTKLCGLEVYQFVQHLVSVVQGELAPRRTGMDAIRAAFPGGSITGAPKVRAMEIIAELEPNARGAYCGSLGYIGFDGTADFSILIRTITAGRGWWQLPVGGGIVAQSEPKQEYEETWHKARGMLRALA
jgi:para-aminobenzoate synthetase component I